MADSITTLKHSALLNCWRIAIPIVDAADSIAYDSHDADDALELGLLSLDQLLGVPLWRDTAERVRRKFVGLDDRRLRRAIVHELINWQVDDIRESVGRAISERGVASVADVRRSPTLAVPSSNLTELKTGLESFLFKEVYRHLAVEQPRDAARRSLREMYQLFTNQPERLPDKFRNRVSVDGAPRAVGDYLAGMTDRFALEEHRRLTE
jgi:dGTPase